MDDAALWKKLNLAAGMRVLVDDPLDVLGPVRAAMPPGDSGGRAVWSMGFARTLEEVEALAQHAAAVDADDPIVWIAYPKGSSTRYRCAFNRDTGWAAMGAVGFEPVRQVSLDEDWSALRFRRVQHIKSMTRGFAMTEEGKALAAAGRAEKAAKK